MLKKGLLTDMLNVTIHDGNKQDTEKWSKIIQKVLVKELQSKGAKRKEIKKAVKELRYELDKYIREEEKRVEVYLEYERLYKVKKIKE
jgi:hypothetical protein